MMVVAPSTCFLATARRWWTVNSAHNFGSHNGAVGTGSAVAFWMLGSIGGVGGCCYYNFYQHQFDHCRQQSQHTTRCEAPIRAKLQRKMTAIGHFSIKSETKYNPSIITFVMNLQGGTSPLTATDFCHLWQHKEMSSKHPRFHQTVVSNKRQQLEFVEDDTVIQDHVTETSFPANRDDLRQRLQQLQLQRWNLADSLWHVWIASNTKLVNSATQTMLLFRGHHALADGASMGAALSDLFDESVVLREQIQQAVHQHRQRRRNKSWWQRFVYAFKQLLCFFVGSWQAIVHQTWLYVHRWLLDGPDPWTKLRQITNTESSKHSTLPLPRTLSWSYIASVEQVKWVAQMLSNNTTDKPVTVNDIFVACTTAALARQLEWHRHHLSQRQQDLNQVPINLPRQEYMHVAVPVHLKGGVVLPNESVGNNIGAFVVRVPCETENRDSVMRLHTVSQALHTIKQTPAALLGHWLAQCVSHASSFLLPASWTAHLFAAANAGSVAVVSNNRGAPMPVHVLGRRVESLYGFVPLPPGIPVGVTVLSYAGEINCTVVAEPYAVPDGDQFLVWMLEEYLRLVEAAKYQVQTKATTTITS